MAPPIPPVADASPFALFFTPARGISAVLIVFSAFYSLHYLACHGTHFISEELKETQTVYHNAFAVGILNFQLDSDHALALDREFHLIEDEASALRIRFLAASPLLLPFIQLVSLIAIARCAYSIRVFKKKIQNPPPRDETIQSFPAPQANDNPDEANNVLKRSQPYISWR
ncbi:hypothetical protein B0H17DRAFT_1143214 [Mycena rosella]|uniref:Uncharacterized protein n=1 Tax=Mycena rosella TaxID=1033263 RepID=A0AAD7CWP2_MYCRO|nr:hypothetical protein B0H17DRAFT_1143214 [Mycena rosella]